MIETIVISLLNALGALLPYLPGLIDRIRGSTELSADGKKVLDGIDAAVAAHEAKLDDIKPLPVPDPKPTPNERPTPPGGE